MTEATPTGEGVGTPETNMTTEEGLIAESVEYPGARRCDADGIAWRGRRVMGRIQR